MKTLAHVATRFNLSLRLLAVLGLFLFSLPLARAADYTWDAVAGGGIDDGGGASWSTVAGQTKWRQNGTDPAVVWPNGATDNAVFGGGTAGTAGNVSIAAASTYNVGNITFNAAFSGNYTITPVNTSTSKMKLFSGAVITVNSDVTWAVPLSGSGFTKEGSGTLTLSGSGIADNTNGYTIINAGKVRLITSSSGRAQLASTNITVKAGTTLEIAPSASAGPLITTANLTNSGGTILVGNSQNIDSLVLESGTLTNSDTGNSRTLTVANTINLQSGAMRQSSAGTRNFVLGGTATMSKTTAGTVYMGTNVAINGSNPGFQGTWTGKSTISEGTLKEFADNGVGVNPASFVADQLTLNGGTLAIGDTFSWGGNRGTTLGASGGTIEVDSGVTLTWSSTAIIAGTSGGGLTKTGNGTLLINQVNTYDGATTISNGILQLTSTSFPGNGAGALNLSGGALQISTGRDITTAPIRNALNVTANSTIQVVPATASAVELNFTNNSISGTGGTLTFSNLNTGVGLFQPRFSGVGFNLNRPIVIANGPTANTTLMSANASGTQTFSGALSGAGSFRRLTAGGTTVLSAVNTYSGATTVSAGSLLVDGELTTSAVTVSSGATLGGNGKIGTATVSGSGKLSPGASVGTLTVTNLTLNATTTNIFEFDVAGGSNDLLIVEGDLNPADSRIQVDISGGSLAVGEYTIITYTGTKTGSFDDAVILGSGAALGVLSIDDSTAGVIKLVVAEGPSAINFIQQPTDTVAGVVISPAITVQATNDSGGVAGVSITLSLLSGTGTLQGTLTQATDGSGIATFDNLTNTTSGTKQLRAVNTVNSLTNDSSNFEIFPAAADKLVFVGNPASTNAGAVISPAVTVQLQDAYGNNVPDTGTNVTLTLNGGGTLNGTTTQATDGGGLATFADLSINEASNDKTLTAEASPLTSANSTAFNITAADADHLVLSQAIVSPQLDGANFTPAPKVTVVDTYGNVVSNSTAEIVAGLNSTDGVGALAGTTSVNANGTSGTATFSALKFVLGDPTGSENVVVDFSSTGLTTVTNSSIVVGPAVALAFDQQPTDTTAGANISPNVTVLTTNANTGDPLPGIAVTISKIAGSGTLEGTLTQVSDGTGVATFTNLVIKAAGSGKQLRATHSTVTTDSTTFTINPATFTKLQVLAPGETNAPGGAPGKGGTVTGQHVGTAFNVTVNAVDDYWNIVSTAPADSILVTTSDPSDTEPAANTLSGGTRTFSINPATVGSLTATATNETDGGITSDTSSSIPVYHTNPFYRSKAVDLTWTHSPASAVWEKSTDDGATWSNATEFPTNLNSDAIYITNNARISVTNAITVDDVVIYAGATNRCQTGAALTIAHRTGATTDFDVYGQLSFSANAPATVSSGAIVRFENGGLFLWASASAPSILKSIWETGSTCMVSPGAGSGTPSAASLNQAFYNFTWNWPGMTASTDCGGNLTNVSGTLTVSAGTSASAGAFKLANGAGAGVNSVLNIGGDLIVNSGFFCTLGGSVAASTATLNIGGNVVINSGATLDTRTSGTGAGARFNITGAGPHYFSNSGGISNSGSAVGNSIWTIKDGATMTITNGNLQLFNGSTLVVESNATLNATAGGVTVSQGTGNAIVWNNYDNSSFDGTISGALSLTKNGTGELTLTAANTFTSATVINNGTLALTGSGTVGGSPTITVGSGATFDVAAVSPYSLTSGQTLKGNGSVNGTVSVTGSATVAPGTSIGTITFTNAPTLSGTNAMEINRTNSPNADKLVVVPGGGTLVYGGTLTVTATGNSLIPGDTFDLFDADSFSGSFSTLNLPSLTGGLQWNTSQLTVDGSISVVCGTLTVGPATLADGATGMAYNQTITASGGSSPYTFAVTGGGLPTGLMLDGDGTLHGTPTVAESTNFTITATDANGCTGVTNYTVTITVGCPTITVGPATLADGTVNASYSDTNTASGGAAPYTFAVTSGALPDGLTLNTNTGEIAGTPTTPGTNNFTITATDTDGCTGSHGYTVVIGCQTITVGPATLADGVAGTSYSQTNTAAGAVGTTTFGVTSGLLPAGLTLNTNTGVISGIPTTTGTNNFTVTATDTNGCTGSQGYTVVISCPTITVAPATLAAGTIGLNYADTNTASGGTPPYTFAVTSGGLPPGLSLNSAGEYSGTPTTTGEFDFTVTATDAYGCTGSSNYSIAVNCPTITVGPATLADGTVNADYADTNSASGGAEPYIFAVIGGSLPAGLTLNTNTGEIAGTPTTPGTNTFTITATDTNGCTGSQGYTVVITCPIITIAPATLPDGTNGVAYSEAITASGGSSPYTFTVTGGGLLAGLMLDGDGTLHGTPAATGSTNFTITATDANGCTGVTNYTVTIAAGEDTCPVITLSSLTNAIRNKGYTNTVVASGGTGPYTYVMTAGALPVGLQALTAGGLIKGKATAYSANHFTVEATDINGCKGTNSYTLLVTGPTADVTEPAVVINYPANNGFVTNASVVVTSTVTDFISGVAAPVTNVEVSVDGGAYVAAAQVGVTTKWVLNIGAPTPGPHTVAVRGTDMSGNTSSGTKARTNTFFYGVYQPLTIMTNGNGTVKGTKNGNFGTPTNQANLVVGKPNYKVAVKPGSGWLFSNLVYYADGTATNTQTFAALKGGTHVFTMQTNYTILVNFVTNRFYDVAGTYYGLFSDEVNGVNHKSGGFFTLKTTAKLAFSGKLTLDGNSLPFSGTFNLDGNGKLTKVIDRTTKYGKSNLTLVVQLPFDGSDTITGSVTNLDTTTNTWVSALEGDRAVFKTMMASDYAGSYTLVLPGFGTPATLPGGAGYGTVIIKTNGLITLAGALGDGAKLAQSGVSVGKNGDWPLYVAAYKDAAATGKPAHGSIQGWVTVSNAPGNNLAGTLTWVFPGNTPAGVNAPSPYTTPFKQEVTLKASPYVPPVNPVHVIGITNGILVLGQSDLLGTATTNTLVLSDLNKFAVNKTNTALVVNKPTVALTPKTGLLKVKSVLPTINNGTGVLLQQQGEGEGIYKGTTQTGSFLIQGN